MRLLSLLVWLAFAISATALITDGSDGQVLETNTSSIVKRSGRPVCGPNLAPENTTSACDKKLIPRDKASVSQYLSNAWPAQWSRLRAGLQWSTGTDGLSGCTTLYIISRTGVYAAHYFENVSFEPDPFWRTGDHTTNDQLFQYTVIDVLRNGGRYHPRLNAARIEDDTIRAYLIYPAQTSKESADDVGYSVRNEQIRTTVGEIVPTLQDGSRWTNIPYQATDSQALLFDPEKTLGKNLFKYDPAHDFGGGQKKHLAALWVEDERVHWDYW
ncbi:uncharacterized protein N7446_005024 [Penicillium canescens]|uniref:uncharacterized protein n=1 Tax=Penicillium canescens TaxID=5083 RepID=UPI0026E08BE6|nr:uncharacterized protein N7446_005024 [Penicillium canescens]KAJ6067987.1 hypothetical protein N7446_005024 [Penicillium canescens]